MTLRKFAAGAFLASVITFFIAGRFDKHSHYVCTGDPGLALHIGTWAAVVAIVFGIGLAFAELGIPTSLNLPDKL